MAITRESDRLWLKRHEAREVALSAALASYFVHQAERIADAVLQFDQPTPSIVPQVFRPADEHERLMETAARPLLVTMALGASVVMDEADRVVKSPSQHFDFGIDPPLPIDIPPDVMGRIRRALDELQQQPYWMEIQKETQTRLTHLIGDGMLQGANNQQIAKRLREELGGFSARRRSRTIARTETTSALNAGHQQAGESLVQMGFIVRKSWSTVGDVRARETHQAVNGQIVAIGGTFNVGGFQTPYPGHWSLPARERVNCRCSTFTDVDD